MISGISFPHKRQRMPAPIALQLYTVRDLIEEDFEGVVRKVAEIGYAGVEPSVPATKTESAGKGRST